jgi:hypothetical protein
MVIVAKRFGTYVSRGNLALLGRKFIVHQGSFLFVEELIFFLVKVVFWGTSFAP